MYLRDAGAFEVRCLILIEADAAHERIRAIMALILKMARLDQKKGEQS
jgi:hypothetical protein